jgi:2-methylisocitrate lyase-like PEP mutase family enzyme
VRIDGVPVDDTSYHVFRPMVSGQSDKYEKLRLLHARPGIFVIPNPWDAGSARILTALGFEALATTSAGFAFSAGRSDMGGGVTRTQILENARSIVEATHLPVSADLQNGFGHSPEECATTVQAACDVGLAGGSIEDATGNAANPIYDFEQAVERVHAASDAAHRAGFLLTARAENFLWARPDLDDTIRRLEAFSKAGADVLYAPGLPSLDAIRTLCAAVDKPVNVVMGLRGPAVTVDQLRDAGVKRVSVGGSFARAAMGALIRAAVEVRDYGTFTYAGDAVSHADATAFMRKAHE